MYAVSQNCSSFCFVRFFIFLPRVVPATEPNELMSTTMVLREEPTNGPGYCHPILNFSRSRNCNNFPTEDNLWALVHNLKSEKSYEGLQKIAKGSKTSSRIRWSDWKSASCEDIITILMRFTLAKQCHLRCRYETGHMTIDQFPGQRWVKQRRIFVSHSTMNLYAMNR